MMTFLILLLAVGVAGLIIELAAARAPLGYQNESGFYFGRERAASADEFECGNPS